MKKDGLIPAAYRAFQEKYDAPGYDFDINVVRIIVCSFFIWKLLSRDFGFYGHVPAELFQYYPINIYPSHSYVLLTGLPIVSDIVTFHWIHWILPRPDALVLRSIQGLAVVLLLAYLLFGRAPSRILPILCYCLLIYLWGHLFLAGHDVDAVALYFGMLLVLAFAEYKDGALWQIRKLFGVPANRVAGRAVSLLFLVITTYYFASGVNKLTDISLIDFTQYDLGESLHYYRIRSDHGYILVPTIFEPLYDARWLAYLGPPIVYISHLITPLVFFYRNMVLKFFLFYALFHFLVFGVGISFTGYVFVWFVLFPYHAIISRMSGASPDKGPVRT